MGRKLPDHPRTPPGAVERFIGVNGVRLRYLVAGDGSPVVLLHGYTQTSHMWRPILPLLARRHTVIAPDLRGAGVHLAALSAAIATFGASARAGIEAATQLGDADTADLFTEISRGVDKLRWKVEPHAQGKD